MKNLKKLSKENLKLISGGMIKCCTTYPPSLARCCNTPSSMSCPPPWVEGSFPSGC